MLLKKINNKNNYLFYELGCLLHPLQFSHLIFSMPNYDFNLHISIEFPPFLINTLIIFSLYPPSLAPF